MTLKKRNIVLLAIICLLCCYSFGQERFKQSGTATYYADYFQGRNTTSGEKYNKALYTAAHPTLPFQTIVKVTNLKNNLSVIVKINDRCPWHYKRIIDLSRVAAIKLDMILAGVANVIIEEMKPEDLNIISKEPPKTDTIIIKRLLDFPGLMENQIQSNPENLMVNEKCPVFTNYIRKSPTADFMLKPKEVGIWMDKNLKHRATLTIISY